MKPTRTSNNKAPKSGAIRKGSMPIEEITKVAQELTKCPEIIEEVQAPAIEPVVKGDYEIYSAYVKAHCKVHDTYETTCKELKKMFPQVRWGSEVAVQLKRSYGLSYRRVENSKNDTYVFFVEPTREELTVMLTSAESKLIELNRECNYIMEEELKTIGVKLELQKENTQLKSELSNSQKTNYILFAFAIGAVITILIKSVSL